MTKKRKQQSSAALPWKKVDTAQLPEPSSSINHYDDARQLRASQELEANPGESVALFFGLEVISGDDYTVNKDGQLEVVDKNNRDEKKQGADEPSEGQERESTAAAPTKKRKAQSEEPEAAGEPLNADEKDSEPAKKPKKRKKKKKKRKKTTDQEQTSEEQHAEADGAADDSTDSSAEVERMQTAWMVATGGVELHLTLCTSLLQQQFWTPTPIQAATLPAAILGRRNVVGAAPTGSGKTLAYLLPILQSLLTSDSSSRVLQALILTPTRELALQVNRECDALSGDSKTCATIVGGLALAKQQRVLAKNKPPILVATPGRLWELVSPIRCVLFTVVVWSRMKIHSRTLE